MRRIGAAVTRAAVARAAVVGAVLVGTLGLGVLTACGPDRPAAGPSPSATVPAGGWPQPSAGAFTAAMCGLLTPADLAPGWPPTERALPVVEPDTLICGVLGGPQYELYRQPNAESAGLLYTATLDREQHPSGDVSPRQTRTDVVPGAEESAVVSGGPDAHGQRYVAVLARRRALVVRVSIYDPADRASDTANLARLLLERAPGVGTTDTGPTHAITYQVTGSGRLSQLVYRDPLTGQVTTLHDVVLPWSIRLPYVIATQRGMLLASVDAWAAAGARHLACTLANDGTVARQDESNSSVHCSLTP